MKLSGKTAIVTGGGRGIGRAIAEAFAREGANVIVSSAKNIGEIESVAAQIGGLAVQADVTVLKDCKKLRDAVLEKYGRIDILVNNAGRGMKFVNKDFMTDPKPFWKADPDMWKLVIDTNVTGVFFMTRTIAPLMIKQGKGSIINISMNYETMKRKGFTPYGPSKAALESMSIIWAQELEGTGVTLNMLLPGGATLTGMIPDSYPEDRRTTLLDPAIMGAPAVYLASDESSGINGKRIVASEWNKMVK
jgi:3-oxoacyl-[acyl-carrier protein] reductase